MEWKANYKYQDSLCRLLVLSLVRTGLYKGPVGRVKLSSVQGDSCPEVADFMERGTRVNSSDRQASREHTPDPVPWALDRAQGAGPTPAKDRRARHAQDGPSAAASPEQHLWRGTRAVN